jgi:hypothetical protein
VLRLPSKASTGVSVEVWIDTGFTGNAVYPKDVIRVYGCLNFPRPTSLWVSEFLGI